MIGQVVSRKNTVNGIVYREDAAILAWETGNELLCPSGSRNRSRVMSLSP